MPAPSDPLPFADFFHDHKGSPDADEAASQFDSRDATESDLPAAVHLS